MLASASRLDDVASISDRVGDLGGYLREQREHARLSLRQLAQLAGVSNPYLSQVERGLRNPSAEVLQQIARGLQISAEALYVRAGILESEQKRPDVEAAVHADPDLSDRQKRVLLDIYSAFRTENARIAAEPEAPEPLPRRRTVKRSATSSADEAPAVDKPVKAAKRVRRAVKQDGSSGSDGVTGSAGSGSNRGGSAAAEAEPVAAPVAKVPGRRLPARRPRTAAGGSVPGRRPRRAQGPAAGSAEAGSAQAGSAQTGSTPGSTTTPTDD